MALDNSLPFMRGSTWKDGNTASTAVPNIACLGAAYPTTDGGENVVKPNPIHAGATNVKYAVVGGHGTGMAMELKVIANLSGSAISLTRAGLKASTGNTNKPGYGINVTPGDGGLGTTLAYLADDAYASGTTIAAGDCFYAVAKGPVLARVSVTPTAIVRGDPLVWNGSGRLRKAGTNANNHSIVATAMISATTNNTTKLVFMHGIGP